jgi:hypothetical protein
MKIREIMSWAMVIIITYLFLSLCNWNLSVSEWNGFSRFILGIEGVVFLLWLLNDKLHIF